MGLKQRYEHPTGCYRTAWGTWFVQVRYQNKLTYLGTTDNENEAVALRDAYLEQRRAADPKTDRSEQGGTLVDDVS